MTTSAAPRPTLTVLDTAALIVGVVIGAGIFKTPAMVAANTGTPGMFMFAWLLGGIISLIGALCYAELTTTYPHAGGDYHFLGRAFGGSASFLFAWARMTVIQTGSIALHAFIIGDYASELLRLGSYSSSLYAGLVIAIITGLNIAGLRSGKWTQIVLTGGTVTGVLFVALAGLAGVSNEAATPAASAASDPSPALGLAMVFVLLTYGGWNEAAYLSAELRDVRRNMVRALFWGLGVVTLVYVLVNVAYLRGLGISGMAGTEVVAAELMRRTLGEGGAKFISLLIVLTALSNINGTVITGARTNYALGQDFSMFRLLGRWHERAGTPTNALLAQGAIALALVLLGTLTPEHGGGLIETGFTRMVEFTSPVFWFFFLMVGLSLFVLRRKDAQTARPFAVPLYPLTPLLFCAICLYMLWSSLAYNKTGAWLGVAVLLAGVPLLLLARARPSLSQERMGTRT